MARPVAPQGRGHFEAFFRQIRTIFDTQRPNWEIEKLRALCMRVQPTLGWLMWHALRVELRYLSHDAGWTRVSD